MKTTLTLALLASLLGAVTYSHLTTIPNPAPCSVQAYYNATANTFTIECDEVTK